jgi:hypothetical protein
MVADLVHFTRSVVDSDNATYIIITFSSCRAFLHCRLAVLSLENHANRRIVVQRVAALSLGSVANPSI